MVPLIVGNPHLLDPPRGLGAAFKLLRDCSAELLLWFKVVANMQYGFLMRSQNGSAWQPP